MKYNEYSHLLDVYFKAERMQDIEDLHRKARFDVDITLREFYLISNLIREALFRIEEDKTYD